MLLIPAEGWIWVLPSALKLQGALVGWVTHHLSPEGGRRPLPVVDTSA